MDNNLGREIHQISKLTSCPCGSSRFLIDYATRATLSLHGETPEAITYRAISDTEMFSTVSCGECGTWLDVDGSLMGKHALTVGAFYAFYVARYRGDVLAQKLPSVTVRTKEGPMRPVGSPPSED